MGLGLDHRPLHVGALREGDATEVLTFFNFPSSVLINEKLDLDYGTFEPVVPPVCHPIPYANNYGSTHIQAHPGLIMQINWWM